MTNKPRSVSPFGVRTLPDRYVRQDLDDLSTVTATSDLDLHILRLLALHPTLKVRFRNQDLAALDDSTKQTLLADMNQVLGIRPRGKRPS
jgi:hypothetical protein